MTVNSNNIWDKMAKSFHHTSSRSKAHKDKYLTVAKMINDINPKNVLDLGCGSGLLENELLKLGFNGEITAIDGSSEMLNIAKGLCGDKVKFIQADLDKEIKFKKKFDVIVTINVLFFIKDKTLFLKNIHDLLFDKRSKFILINPKPNDQSSNWQFIKAHYAGSTVREKVLITINEIINLPRYIEMVLRQSKLNKMAKKGKIVFDKDDNIKKTAESVGLIVEKISDIHAGQNWLFNIRKS